MKNLNWKRLALRLLIAILFGGAVAWIALSAGRRQAEHSIAGFQQRQTQKELTEVVEVLEKYRRKTHALPRSLSQVKWGDGDLGTIPDGWGRPFVYTVQGTHYRVVSYGEDGKPGGTGWDTDLSSDNPHPPGMDLTFRQFLTNPETQEMAQAAYLSGLLAALLCLVTVRPKAFSVRHALALTAQILVTLLAASYVGLVITALHLPSGH